MTHSRSSNKTKATDHLPSAYLPVIHLNGTGRATLKDDYYKAYKKLQEFREALASVNFHARDYYVIDDPSAFSNAQDTRQNVFGLIDEINSYLEDHLYTLID